MTWKKIIQIDRRGGVYGITIKTLLRRYTLYKTCILEAHVMYKKNIILMMKNVI